MTKVEMILDQASGRAYLNCYSKQKKVEKEETSLSSRKRGSIISLEQSSPPTLNHSFA